MAGAKPGHHITSAEKITAARDRGCQGLAGLARTGQAIGAGAGVGIAGVDNESTDCGAAGQVLAADLHGCRAEAVGGEHAGGTRLVSSRYCSPAVFASPWLSARTASMNSESMGDVCTVTSSLARLAAATASLPLFSMRRTRLSHA